MYVKVFTDNKREHVEKLYRKEILSSLSYGAIDETAYILQTNKIVAWLWTSA